MAKNRSTAPEAGQVKARVLVSCVFGEPNDVVTLTQPEADEGVASGVLDATVEAVAYAESIDGPAA